jgi:hypothetical protein
MIRRLKVFFQFKPSVMLAAQVLHAVERGSATPYGVLEAQISAVVQFSLYISWHDLLENDWSAYFLQHATMAMPFSRWEPATTMPTGGYVEGLLQPALSKEQLQIFLPLGAGRNHGQVELRYVSHS